MKRARYDGPHAAVEVWPHGYTGPSITVENGHLLPTEDNQGNPIPASFRDSLLEQADAWSEVDQSSTKKKED
jgi:hypothetical protein